MLLGYVGMTAIQEVKPSEDGMYIDILFEYHESSYVLEVKIGDSPRDFLKAIAQAYGYALKKGTNNIIVIRYPPDARKRGRISQINEIALDRTCESIFLTKEWGEYVELSPKESLTNLKAKIDNELLAAENIELVSH